jgi:DNA modification methylase
VSEGYSGGRIVHKGRLATVICGDAREVLAGMEKETVDLVVVDPPYGMEFVSRKRTESFGMLAGDGVDRVGVHEIIEGCVRVVGQDRHLYVFGPADVLDGLKVSEPAPMVWDKVVNGMGQGPWAPAHEPINFAVSRHRHAGKAGKSNRPVRLRKGSVLRFQRQTGRNVRHPTEKPVGLLCELIESSSRAGELVFDPCAGSGSTGVAAVIRGRRALLVEVEERYALLAARRVRAAEEIADRTEEL